MNSRGARLVAAFLFAATLGALTPNAAIADVAKPPYVAASGTCTTSAVLAKANYVMQLLKQYNDDNAPSLSERQVERIWDRQGQCNGSPADASISRTAKTAFITAVYFGSYMTAKVKYERGKLAESRYFVDEFLVLAPAIRNRATALGWNDWLKTDRPYTKQIGLLDAVLTRRGYPRDPGVAAMNRTYGP